MDNTWLSLETICSKCSYLKEVNISFVLLSVPKTYGAENVQNVLLQNESIWKNVIGVDVFWRHFSAFCENSVQDLN